MDNERIARLTELAARAWPGDRVDIRARGEAVRISLAGGPDTGMPQLTPVIASIVHPRGLDALEAALLVLALPARGAESSKSVLDLCRANTELGIALVSLRADVDQLASEWEAQATRQRARGEEGAADARECCAQELRERAKP